MESVRHIPGESHSARLRGLNGLLLPWVPVTIGSKPRHVLEAFIDEIDFQMEEEPIEYRPGVREGGRFLTCSYRQGLMRETGAVSFKETEPIHPVAG